MRVACCRAHTIFCRRSANTVHEGSPSEFDVVRPCRGLDGRDLPRASAVGVHPLDLQRLATSEQRDEEDPRRGGLQAFGGLLLEAVQRPIGSILDEDESGDPGPEVRPPRVEVLGSVVVVVGSEVLGHLDASTDNESERFPQHDRPLGPL